MNKDKYEISLWEEILVPTSGGVDEHYEESKVAVIGSDSITAQCRAIEPKLTENINGVNTFSFKMFYTYKDELTGENFQNPFLNQLVNERKVKVYWKSKWYDLIIKNCQEASNGKSIVYTCKDLYINELSKNGFSLEFDNELENNQGTVVELGEKIVAGTDWKIDTINSEIVQQKKEEPVYEINAYSGFTTKEGATITADEKIMIFYSTFQNKKTVCQFYQTTDYSVETNSQLLINGNCYTIVLDSWSEEIETIDGTQYTVWYAYKDANLLFKVFDKAKVSSNYRAEKLVLSQKKKLDTLIDQYVNVYKNGEQEVLGYGKTVYKDPTVVKNLITNNEDFSSTNGWIGSNMQFSLYPPFTGTDVANYTASSFLKLSAGDYFNKGLQESSIYIKDGFQKGQTYIFRFKIMGDSSNKPSGSYLTSGIVPRVCDYVNNSGTLIAVDGTDYVSRTLISSEDNWIEYRLTCTKAITKANLLTENVGLFLTASKTLWIEKVEMFQEVWGESNTAEIIRINPGEMDTYSTARTEYRYYNADQAVTSADNLEYLYIGYTDGGGLNLTPQYNDNYEKIRSVTGKNSNRFNLLQTLAETFECWAQFEIAHNPDTGKIIYVDGIPQKTIKFVNEVGDETGIGFVYGIDLNTITRTITSDQITTKVIVPANSNEFAQNGFCTIARSEENYSRENFILNFDYYINQGLLDSGEVNKDLYLSTDDSIGYYYHLSQWNKEYDVITEELVAKGIELIKQQSLLTVYQEYITSLAEEITSITSEILALASVSTITAATTYIKNNPNDSKVITLMNNLTNLKNSQASTIIQKVSLAASVSALTTYTEEKEDRQEVLKELSKAKHLEFYKKYSRFIQEGSWTSEEYIDDDLYYLDAQNIAYTSSRPQISYGISVMRLSAVEGFENRNFHLGDISYVQDTEFFGYTYVNGVKTPYKEKVLISEVSSWFDAPSKDSFTVQNFKTQFEDLFQRITATTQSLQYASGGYSKASNSFTDEGLINTETLQSSIALNQQLVFSAQDDTIYQDSTGITLTNSTSPNNKTKITSGGLFITIDGGKSWKNAIRGEGISTQYLTAGSLNVSNITVLDGNYTNFRWDKKGINAYYKSDFGINLSKFVRFDHHGLYGINSEEGADYEPATEDDIWNDANFGMTWKGFFVKNRYGEGFVSVSSVDDIVVSDGTYTRIKIGNLGTDSLPKFGIRIANADGNAVMETNDDGTLWLKNRLNVETDDSGNTVGIGKLNVIDNVHGREVINATDKFIVYEDGSMKAIDGDFKGTIYATDGYFEGEINATSGKIGGMTITEIEDTGYEIVITTDSGTIFKNNTGEIVLIAHLYKSGEEILSGLSYKWKKDNVIIDGATARTLTVQAPTEAEVQTSQYSCEITLG